MATIVTFNGSNYSIPASGEVAWAALSNFLIDVANNAQTKNVQISGIRVAVSTPVTVTTLDYAVVVKLTVPGPAAVTLPPGTDGQTIYIVDGTGDALTNNITVSGSGEDISGSATFVIGADYGFLGVQFSSTTGEWHIVSSMTTIDPANIPDGSIPLDKLVPLTPNRAVITSSTGELTQSTTTDIQIAYVSDVTGFIQAQIDGLQTQINEKLEDDGGTISNYVNLGNQAEVRFQDADGSNYVALKSPAVVPSDVTYELPSTDGLAGQGLITDGAGNLSWDFVAGGLGVINYIDNPDAEVNTTGWVNGTNIAISRVTSPPANVLRGIASFEIATTSSVLAAAAVYTDFFIPEADENKLIGISFDLKTLTYTAGQMAIDIVYDPGGAATVITPSVTNIPAGQGQFLSSFVSGVSGTYRLRFKAVTPSVAYSILIDTVVVGPGNVLQGAALGPWTAYTPTGTWVSNTTYTGYWRRNGENIELAVKIATSSNPGAGNCTVNLPSGLTINTTVLGSASYLEQTSGTATLRIVSTTLYGRVGALTSTSIAIGMMGVAGTPNEVILDSPLNTTYIPALTSNSSTTIVNCTLPINEWMNQGVINIGANDIEYAASTTGTWDAASAATDTTYGPLGAPISGALTAARTKVVRFKYPIQPTETVTLQIQDTGGTWRSVGDAGFGLAQQNTSQYGAKLSATTGTTDVSVVFAIKAQPLGAATFGTNTGSQDWGGSEGIRWRVVKAVANQAIGFGIASGGKAGLISYYEEGSFTATLTGVSGTVTRTLYYVRIGAFVIVSNRGGNLAGTSNTTAATITGLPSAITPTVTQNSAIVVINNSVAVSGACEILNTGVVNLFPGPNGGTFTASGTKGVAVGCFTYSLL